MKFYKCILILTLIFCKQLTYATELDKLKKNFNDYFLLEEVRDTEVQLLLEIMNNDFYFPDIDYNMHRRSNWEPRTHLQRLILIAKAYKNKNSTYYHSKNIAKIIIGALNFWSYNNFYSDNWWQQEIGIPQSIGPTLILCESIIPDSTMTKSLKVMDKSKIYKTGQNKIWLSGNVFMRELMRGNEHLIKIAADAIKSVTVKSKPYEEGIQPDYSFHQHGPQPQFGNYGLSFTNDIIKWMFIFNKTDITFSSDKIDLMRKVIFEGQQKVVYKGKYEILATGRQIFPERVNGETFRGPISKYKHYKFIEKVFNTFDTQKNPPTSPNGYVHFRNSDYSLFRTNSFLSAVRMSSKRVIGAEAGNGENLAGYYLGDGTNLIYRTGNEYHEIYPVWNWKKLPGTTIVQDTAKLPVLSWKGYRNNSDFSGGLKGKHIGITAFKYRRDSLHANKSYFFIDNKVYALGSGISTTRNFKVVTTINQSYKKGEVSINKNHGETTSVWHDSIAYISLIKQKLKIKQGEQTGTWKKVLSWQSDTLITKNIFDLEINHGVKPNNGKYAYVSVVGIPKNDIKEVIKKQLADIIAHTENVHALSFNNGNTIAISAYKPCEVTIANRQKLIIKNPCLLTLNKLQNGWMVKAVDPSQLQNTLAFEITGKYKIKNTSKSTQIRGNTTLFYIAPPQSTEIKGTNKTVFLLEK